jgi:carboxypeptidase Q
MPTLRLRRSRWIQIAATLLLFAASSLAVSGDQPAEWVNAYREPASRLIGAAMSDSTAWNRLAEMTDRFGHRLAGSSSLEGAITWAADLMRKDGFENVALEPVMVPRWVRGRESVELIEPVVESLAMLGLGGSVATPPEGIEAEVLVVSSFADLDARGPEAKGRIVLYDVPYTNYGETVRYRGAGASRAAQLGAVAALVRAVGPVGLRTPHTGGMGYAEGVARIPVAAISAEDSARLARLQQRGQRIRVRLKMEARFEAETASANVVGELRGREKPGEVVVVGCHIDSWDVGTGASDDAVGCVVTWEAVRLMKTLNLRPRRTVRVVLFTNEENGLRGGLGYRDRHREELASHVMMLEADLGVFWPQVLGFTGSDAARATVTQAVTLLMSLGFDRVTPDGGGADIGPSVAAAGIASMALRGDPDRYFLVHHTPADTIDRIDRSEVARATAAIAVMTYVVADLPERLPAAVK